MPIKIGPPVIVLALSLGLAAGCASSATSSKVALRPDDSYSVTAAKMKQFGRGLAHYDLCVQSGGAKLRGIGAWLKEHQPDQAEALIDILVEAHIATLEETMAQLSDSSLPGARSAAPSQQFRDICRKNAHLYNNLEFPSR